MEENKLLSVIIPNYNKEKYIRSCVESVLTQTYRPIEIVIVDDCSTDNSRNIILEMSDEFQCIKPIFQESNSGVSVARNTGAMRSSGKYITFLDSDDFYVNNDKLSYEMQLLLTNSEKILSYSTLVYVDEEGKQINKPEISIIERLIGNCSNKIIRNCPFEILPRDYCINKQAFFKAGMYDANSAFYEDLDLLIRLSVNMDMRYTGVAGTAYRQVGTGLSSRSKAEQLRGRWKVSYNCVKSLKKCRTFKNIVYLCVWKIIIESKILLKRLFKVED